MSVATPTGLLNCAAPPPARVVTTPAGVILRMVLFPESATYKFAAVSVATPAGPENAAAAPLPSALPETPAVPASVVTTPAGVILRIVLFPGSATYKFPAVSVATPAGPENAAAAPLPSALPKTPAVPASVVTTPAGVILRIVWFPESAT